MLVVRISHVYASIFVFVRIVRPFRRCMLHATCGSYIGSGVPPCPSPPSMPPRPPALASFCKRKRNPLDAHQYGRAYAQACRRQAIKGFEALSVAQALVIVQAAEQAVERILKQQRLRANAEGQRRAARVELCALRRALAKRVGAERVVPAPPLAGSCRSRRHGLTEGLSCHPAVLFPCCLDCSTLRTAPHPMQKAGDQYVPP